MTSEPPPALVINRREIAARMAPSDYVTAVERGFRASAANTASSPVPMHLPMPGGGFHAKGARMTASRDYVALKFNGNFPENAERFGLPTIQGAILLCDGTNGTLLAILDSIEVTLRRTAAASALAARLLALPDSRTVLICGCGEQGRAHMQAFNEVLSVERWLVWDRNPQSTRSLAQSMSHQVAGEIHAVEGLWAAARAADIIATCTTARVPFLGIKNVKRGTFIAAVGADNPEKSEVEPGLMARAKVVPDVLAQCAIMGDLHHALRAGVISERDVAAELADIVIGASPGREAREEIIIFDSTGTAIEDVATAAAIYERCIGDTSLLSVELGAA